MTDLPFRRYKTYQEAIKGIGDPYQNIANAIIIQAAKDYLTAIRWGNKYEMRTIEKWFHSEQYRNYTDIDPDWLIARLQEKAKQRRLK